MAVQVRILPRPFLQAKNMNPCPHCGAVPSGEMLFGYPVVAHEKDCPLCPKSLDSDSLYVLSALPPCRFLCSLCGCTADTEKELQHSPGCPANPLTN